MTGVRFDLDGRAAVLAELAAAIGKTDDPLGLYDRIGASLAVSTQHRFETESDPDGNPWPASLRALAEGGRTLTDTARLASSITHEASSSGVAIGTNVLYAAIHQTGGVIRAKTSAGLRFRGPGNGGWVTKQQVTIPQREFLGVDDDDQWKISAICAAWLGAVDDQSGRG